MQMIIDRPSPRADANAGIQPIATNALTRRAKNATMKAALFRRSHDSNAGTLNSCISARLAQMMVPTEWYPCNAGWALEVFGANNAINPPLDTSIADLY